MTSDDQESRTTRPTIETVLERMQTQEARIVELIVSSIGRVESRLDKIESRLDTLEGRLATVESQVATLREDMNAGFAKLRDQVLLIHEDNLEIRARHRDLLRRMEELESKAS